MLILVLIVGTLVGTIAESMKPANSAQTNVATDTPVPPQLLEGATLGGTQTGFVRVYGAPAILFGRQAVHYHTAGSNLDVAIFLWESKTGTDHAAHLSDVQIELAPGQQWEAVNEQTICGFLRPLGSERLGETPLHTKEGLSIDEWVYRSPDLAITFPAADFVDHSGHKVTTGTFAIDYLPDLHHLNDPYSGTGHCELSLGRY